VDVLFGLISFLIHHYVNGDFVSPNYYTYEYNGNTNEIIFNFDGLYDIASDDEVAITGKFQQI
jgi:hypothetical protein